MNPFAITTKSRGPKEQVRATFVFGPRKSDCLTKCLPTRPVGRSAGILPAVSGASRSRPARGQDAHAPAGETPTLRKQFVTIFCNSQWAGIHQPLGLE